MATVAKPDPFAQVPSLGAERPVVWPARTHRKLANGLEVVLVESHTIPKFTGELYFRSGNAAAKTPGLAEITATVVRTGTQERSSREIEEDLRRIGADIGTSAGADTSAIGFNGLVEFSSDLLKLVAELAQQASFPQDEFERERRQMIEGLRIARTTPSFLANERMRRVLFGAHPYAVIAPAETQVKEYQLAQLAQFYRSHYLPGNALLIAVGDFGSQQMMDEIEGIFGLWKAADVAADHEYSRTERLHV
jgi:zinc protease